MHNTTSESRLQLECLDLCLSPKAGKEGLEICHKTLWVKTGRDNQGTLKDGLS